MQANGETQQEAGVRRERNGIRTSIKSFLSKACRIFVHEMATLSHAGPPSENPAYSGVTIPIKRFVTNEIEPRMVNSKLDR